MARSRNIKPGFFTNEDLPECGIYAHHFFGGLWCHADREGRLEDRPRRLKIQIMPLYDIDCDELLQCLHRKGFILRYSVGEDKYIQILKFSKHQNPHKNEANSTIPAPEPTILYASTIGEGQDDHQRAPADSLNSDSLNSDSLNSDSLERKDSSERQTEESSFTEPERAPVFITVPLVDKTEHEISYDDVEEWRESFPGIDVGQELRKLQQWNKSNPKRRKTKRGIRTHVTSWLSRAQDKAPPSSRPPPRQSGRMSAVEEVELANSIGQGQNEAIDGEAERVDK